MNNQYTINFIKAPAAFAIGTGAVAVRPNMADLPFHIQPALVIELGDNKITYSQSLPKLDYTAILNEPTIIKLSPGVQINYTDTDGVGRVLNSVEETIVRFVTP